MSVELKSTSENSNEEPIYKDSEANKNKVNLYFGIVNEGTKLHVEVFPDDEGEIKILDHVIVEGVKLFEEVRIGLSLLGNVVNVEVLIERNGIYSRQI